MIKKFTSTISGKKLISAGILILFLMTTAVFAASDFTAIKADEDVVYRNILADTMTHCLYPGTFCLCKRTQ